MDELVIPEIIFKDFSVTCNNELCESYGITLTLKAPEQCEEIICGMCSESIPVI